jgi:hypothetical protein
MPQVLTTNALVQCPHGFPGTSTASSDKWSINGGTVLLENDTGTFSCLTNYPCVGYRLTSMGLNATTVDGRKVILVTDINFTQTGLPIRKTEFHSTYDDSTPSGVPAGQPTPPLTPEMADQVEPTVAPPLMAGGFSIATMMPATLPVVFTLSAQNPMQWALRLINETLQQSFDVTNGQPPGLTVTPSGGSWTTPSLVVTATMTATFMAALTPGKHHLYMTGISKRGLFGLGEFLLTVTA